MKKTANHWIAEILGAGQPEKIPAGWVNIETMAKETGLPVRTACSRVAKLIADGKLKRKQFRVKIPGRGINPVWYYAPVTKAK